MIRRPRRGLPAALTALILLVVCALVATIAIQLVAGRPPLISYQAVAADLRHAQWRDLVVAIVAGAAALIGLLLLLAAFVPGRAMVLPLGADDTGLIAGLTRRSLCSTLRVAADSVDGIERCRLRLRGSRITVVTHTDREEDAGLTDAVRAAVNARLDQLAPRIQPTVRVRVHRSRR